MVAEHYFSSAHQHVQVYTPSHRGGGEKRSEQNGGGGLAEGERWGHTQGAHDRLVSHLMSTISLPIHLLRRRVHEDDAESDFSLNHCSLSCDFISAPKQARGCFSVRVFFRYVYF